MSVDYTTTSVKKTFMDVPEEVGSCGGINALFEAAER